MLPFLSYIHTGCVFRQVSSHILELYQIISADLGSILLDFRFLRQGSSVVIFSATRFPLRQWRVVLKLDVGKLKFKLRGRETLPQIFRVSYPIDRQRHGLGCTVDLAIRIPDGTSTQILGF